MRLILLIVITLAINCPSHAANFTNAATADAFLRAAAPTLNYGGAGALSVSGTTAVNGSGVTNGTADSLLRFNTAAMVAAANAAYGPNSWAIQKAQLVVTEVGAPANAIFNRGVGAFEIRWLANDAWTEGTGTPATPTTTGVNYNLELALFSPGADATLGNFTNSGTDATLSFNLALPAALITDLSAGGEVGLFLTAREPGTGFTFDSRSFGTTAARPVLVVTILSRPGIVSVQRTGDDVVLTATNGSAGSHYTLLASPDLATPRGQWQPVTSTTLAFNGSFSLTATNAALAGRQFWMITGR